MKKIILLIITALSLAGCSSIDTKYSSYSDQKLTPKPNHYFVSIYNSQPFSTDQSFTVIGKVEVSGNASEGVTQSDLFEKAKAIARKKGADAIINAKSSSAPYNRVEVYPEYVTYHHHWARYHPAEYVPYTDVLLTLQGELIIFNSEKGM